jgi:hypothetical protein
MIGDPLGRTGSFRDVGVLFVGRAAGAETAAIPSVIEQSHLSISYKSLDAKHIVHG